MAQPEGEQQVANVAKLLDLARDFSRKGLAGLYEFVAYLREHIGDDGSRTPDAQIMSEEEDVVRIMTIHQAKGLEFPAVFVPDLAHEGRAERGGRVIFDEQWGVMCAAAYGIDRARLLHPLMLEAEVVERDKEVEEQKRLLYVALTRARDRLYLGSVLKDGRLQAGRGSLAEVLPATLAQVFGPESASADAEIGWRAASGTLHRFRVCREDSAAAVENAREALDGAARVDDFEPLVDTSTPRQTVIAATSLDAAPRVARGSDSDRALGAFVHRLIQRYGVDGQVSADEIVRALNEILTADDLVEIDDLAGFAAAAARAYAALCGRTDVRELCANGERLHEVPFTMRENGMVLRGTIDCLIRRPDDSLVVLEFKTGRPRPEHHAQLELYKRATERLFAGARVDALLVYPHEMNAV
jgi:ATP-dependent exoDNAse (exonuclease V) beta subunit